jgi:hypothetical protein
MKIAEIFDKNIILYYFKQNFQQTLSLEKQLILTMLIIIQK